MDRLDKFGLENFRIFDKYSEFQFSPITLFTGENNSGKSTVIKAIKLFSEGIKISDFPALNLFDTETNLGDFNNIINKSNDKKHFKICFPAKIGTIKDIFKIEYTFYDGKTEYEHFREFALFTSVEIVDNSGIVLMGLYSGFTPETKKKYDNHRDFPSEKNGDPGLMPFKLNLDLLKKYIDDITKTDFTSLIKQLEKIKDRDNSWWGETFDEDEYSVIDYNIYKYRLSDFIEELHYDRYSNIADYSWKKDIYYGDASENDQMRYLQLKESLKYPAFINQVILPILDGIRNSLDFFRSNNFIHIAPEIQHDRIILNNSNTQYLQKLYRRYEEGEFIRFVRESLLCFGIDGVIEIIPHLTSAFEINLITNVENTYKQKRSDIENREYYDPQFSIFSEDYGLYSENPRINIADLGKGAANVIKLILKIASILISIKDEKSTNQALPERQGKKPRFIIKKTILIEEPESFLHPNWQACLSDFLLYCLKNQDQQFVIETHSEYLIRKLQYLTAKGDIKCVDSSIYYFNNENNISNNEKQVKKIQIQNDGSLSSDFGTGFFDEALNWKFELLKLKNKN